MTEDFEIRITGIDETIELLRFAPKNIVKNAFAKGLAAACVPVVDAMKIPAKTGDLAAHRVTDVAIHEDGLGGTAQIGFGKEGWKARLVETGHRMVGHQPDKKESSEPVIAHPFMGPAAAAGADKAIDAFAETINQSLRGDLLRHAS